MEAILIKHFDILDEQLGALRARIRHLRNIGIPPLHRTGSGTQIQYSKTDLFQLALALELEGQGFAPKIVKVIVDSALHHAAPFLVVLPIKPIFKENLGMIVPCNDRKEAQNLVFGGASGTVLDLAKFDSELDEDIRASGVLRK